MKDPGRIRSDPIVWVRCQGLQVDPARLWADPGWMMGGSGAEPGWLAGGSCMGLLASNTWLMPRKNYVDENRKTGGSDLPRALLSALGKYASSRCCSIQQPTLPCQWLLLMLFASESYVFVGVYLD